MLTVDEWIQKIIIHNVSKIVDAMWMFTMDEWVQKIITHNKRRIWAWYWAFQKNKMVTEAQKMLVPHLFLYKRYRILQDLITWEWTLICNYKIFVHMLWTTPVLQQLIKNTPIAHFHQWLVWNHMQTFSSSLTIRFCCIITDAKTPGRGTCM